VEGQSEVVVVAQEEEIVTDTGEGDNAPSKDSLSSETTLSNVTAQPAQDPALSQSSNEPVKESQPVTSQPQTLALSMATPLTLMTPTVSSSILIPASPLVLRTTFPTAAATCKLPLPRLRPGANALPLVPTVNPVNLSMGPAPSSIIVPKKPRRKRRWRRKPVNFEESERPVKKAKTNKDATLENSSEAPELPVRHENRLDISEDPSKVDSNLPDAILASEDPEESNTPNAEANAGQEEIVETVETIDLTNESSDKEEEEEVVEEVAEASADDADATQEPMEPLRDEPSSKPVLSNAAKTRTGKGRRSRSSYSIAALCQISVNIGGEHSVNIN